MRYRILGSLNVWDGSEWSRLSAAKWRSLLAYLLIHAGRLVSADRLITELWGDHVPPSAAKSLQVYVHRLRRALGTSSHALHSRPGGYELITHEDDVDADRFTRLVSAGQAALASHRTPVAIASLTQALELWRGRALADVPATPTVLAEADRLDECRMAAWEDLGRAKLAAGRHAELAAELRPLLAEQPLREPLWATLIMALHRSGRRSDALHAYARARRALTTELGVEPGSELRRLHRLILDDADAAGIEHPPRMPAIRAGARGVTASGVPSGAAWADAASGAAPPGALRKAPCHLPTAVPDFTGRRTQVEQLLALFGLPGGASGSGTASSGGAGSSAGTGARSSAGVGTGAGTGTGRSTGTGTSTGTGAPSPRAGTPPPRTIAVTGKAGAGKSAFTIHVAHQLRAAFPHGQLYADLRAVGGQAAEPADVLASLLRELGLTGAALPEGIDERARRYRAELAERRMLVVLDNAASERQIRPLLPGAGGSAVLVSSRSALAGIEGALRIGLDVLPDDDALELLARATGDDRTRRDAAAAQRIIRQCGNLPLALRILGARLATRPHLSAGRLADSLVDERHRLDELVAGDLEVRASVSLSYEELDAGAQRAFRLLAMVAAPTVPSWVASALLDCPQGVGDRIVDTLVDHHLLEIVSVDGTGEPRFRLHDLVRLYGCERAEAQEPPPERRAALLRVCTAYLDFVERADAKLDASFLGALPAEEPAPVVPWRPDAAHFARLLTAPLAWLDAERGTLCALVRQAAELGATGLAWRLAASLAAYFENTAHFDDWRHTHRVALGAAGRAGDRFGEAVLHRNLGELATVEDRYVEAGASFERALKKSAEHRRESTATAVDADSAAAAAVGAGAGAGATAPRDSALLVEAVAGIGLGVLLRLRGRYDESTACLHRGAGAAREAGNTRAEVYARSALASVHLERGTPDAAQRELQEALELSADTAHRSSVHSVQRTLGLVELASGRLPQAAQRMELAQRMALARGDRVGAVHAQQWLGHLTDVSGDPARAERMLAACLAAYRRFGERFGEALTLRALGDLHLHAGRVGVAEETVQSSLSIWHGLGTPYWTSRTLDLLAEVHTTTGRNADATAARAAARALRDSLGLPSGLRPVRVDGRSLGGHLSLADGAASS